MKHTLVAGLLALATTVSTYGIEAPQERYRGAIGPGFLTPSPEYYHSREEHYRPVYYISSIGSGGNTLSTHDETVWLISPKTARRASRWVQETPIVITPNHSWFSSYDYCLINQINGQSVEADLSQSPLVKYSLFTTYIDPYHGYIQLEDNSQWQVDVSSKLYTWKVGQAILIGENSSWFGRESILINVNENNYMAATKQR